MQLSPREATSPREADALFEVLDVLGACELVRASATLDGSIPLRAAQACSPLLDGNRFGFQISLREPVRIERNIAGLKTRGFSEAIARAHSGNFPRLVAEGLLDPKGKWVRCFSRAPIALENKPLGPARLSLFTGLLVRPRPGAWLRISNAGNRRNQSFTIGESWIADDDRFVPLVLSLAFARDIEFPMVVAGELATLAPFRPDVECERQPLWHAPEIGRAHADFYDASYFREKKRGPTQKYKKLVIRDAPAEGTRAPGKLLLAEAGHSALTVSTQKKLVTPSGTEIVTTSRVPSFTFANTVGLRARFDGHNTFVEPEPGALADHARAVDQAFVRAFGAEFVAGHRGAIWYFSKYVTPHQPGEPYFFLKPPVLFRTSPGWSLLIEGLPGAAYDVLRGVVASDVFHAAPTVFRLNHPGRSVSIDAGTELATLTPFPRALLGARFESVTWSYR